MNVSFLSMVSRGGVLRAHLVTGSHVELNCKEIYLEIVRGPSEGRR